MPPDPVAQAGRLPRHVAIIMDGNGRWAARRGLARIEGHRIGADSVRDIVRASRQLGLQALTLYAFSAQNWARPADEIAALMELLRDYVIEERDEILENEIRLSAIGELDRLPGFVRQPLDGLIRESGQNRAMTLTLALSYGGRESIVAAVREAVAATRRGEVDAASIDAACFARLLPSRDLPPLDLLIRTSGEMRISNFLLWELAYTELYFTDTLWPDFRRLELFRALDSYAQRERRFGKTGHQVGGESDLSEPRGR